MSALNRSEYKALAFLRQGALVRVDGEWRFGGTRVGDTVVERLITAGRATRLWPNTSTDCVIRCDR